jgi:hypothetical protein
MYLVCILTYTFAEREILCNTYQEMAIWKSIVTLIYRELPALGRKIDIFKLIYRYLLAFPTAVLNLHIKSYPCTYRAVTYSPHKELCPLLQLFPSDTELFLLTINKYGCHRQVLFLIGQFLKQLFL